MADDPIALQTTDNLAASRTILNNWLTYIQRNYSGALPASPVAFQTMVDTTTTPDSFSIRNAANSALVVLFPDITVAGGGLLAKTGGTMSGAIAMGSTKITGLANGTAAGDAVNKGQVDARILSCAYYLGTLSATATFPVFLTPQAYTTIVSAYLVTATSLATSGSAYWSFGFYNVTDAVYLQTGTGPTTPTLSRLTASTYTAGTATTANVPYSLAVDQNNGDGAATLAASKVVQLIATATGGPASLAGCTLFVNYKTST